MVMNGLLSAYKESSSISLGPTLTPVCGYRLNWPLAQIFSAQVALIFIANNVGKYGMQNGFLARASDVVPAHSHDATPYP
jgi:hypothetical protein